jgi:hypothetical protein
VEEAKDANRQLFRSGKRQQVHTSKSGSNGWKRRRIFVSLPFQGLLLLLAIPNNLAAKQLGCAADITGIDTEQQRNDALPVHALMSS